MGGVFLAGDSEGVRLPINAQTASIRSDYLEHGFEVGPNRFAMSMRRIAKYSKELVEAEIDNMTIKVGLTGITIMGRRNTIRNSRIEVTNPRAGIYLFGPDNLIENNILIFRGKPRTDSAAPIKLHAGSRTVIRNNVIIIDTPSPRQAISLIESEGVVLKGNRVFGAGKLVQRYDKDSTFSSTDDITLDSNRLVALPPDARRADQVPR